MEQLMKEMETIKSDVSMSWEIIKIQDFAEVTTGGTPSTTVKDYWDNGNIAWLNSGELNQDFITECENYITEKGLANSSARLMPKDTVLIALTGATTGVVGYLTFEACANQSVTGILPSKKHHPKYLYYYLKSIRNKVIADAYGGAQKHISQGYVKELKIPLPPLPIQKRIAQILDAADALKRKDQELLKKYDELAQAIFIDMFGDPVKNEKGWEVKKLEDLSMNQKGSIRTGPFGSQLLIEELLEEGIPVYGIDNVQDFGFVWAKPKHITDEKFHQLKGFRINKGDVLITRTGTVGRSCVAPDEIPDSIIGPNLLRVSLNHQLLLPEIFSFILNRFRSIKEKIKSMSPGATVAVFNSDNLKGLEIYAPPINLQKTFLESYLKINICKLKIQQNKSNEIFDSLIQKAFKGELV